MAAYRRFYDSPHLQAGYQEPQEPESAPRDPTLCIRVWATFTLFYKQNTRLQSAPRRPLPSAVTDSNMSASSPVCQERKVLSCLVFNRPRRPECCLLQAILICLNNSSDGRERFPFKPVLSWARSVAYWRLRR